MYIILKTGLTACGKVWKEGERISDASAKEMGFDKWFESLEEDARQRSFVSVTDAKLEETENQKENVNVETDDVLKTVLEIVKTKNLTLEEALALPWTKKTQAFGFKLAKVVNDYGKSISTK